MNATFHEVKEFKVCQVISEHGYFLVDTPDMAAVGKALNDAGIASVKFILAEPSPNPKDTIYGVTELVDLLKSHEGAVR